MTEDERGRLDATADYQAGAAVHSTREGFDRFMAEPYDYRAAYDEAYAELYKRDNPVGPYPHHVPFVPPTRANGR